MSSYSTINSSKRGQFEDQLRSLQSDIAELSSKLSIPQVIIEDKSKVNSSQISSHSQGYGDMENIPINAKGNIARLKKENHDLLRERDEYHFRYEQVGDQQSKLL
jgi:TolA-binding protein